MRSKTTITLSACNPDCLLWRPARVRGTRGPHRARGVGGESRRQTVGTGSREAQAGTLSDSPFASFDHLQTACKMQILHPAARTPRVLWSMVYILHPPSVLSTALNCLRASQLANFFTRQTLNFKHVMRTLGTGGGGTECISEPYPNVPVSPERRDSRLGRVAGNTV